MTFPSPRSGIGENWRVVVPFADWQTVATLALVMNWKNLGELVDVIQFTILCDDSTNSAKLRVETTEDEIIRYPDSRFEEPMALPKGQGTFTFGPDDIRGIFRLSAYGWAGTDPLAPDPLAPDPHPSVRIKFQVKVRYRHR